jgi:hypothetical protein
MDTKDLIELYKSLFETWRFEVNSHWQRSSYFAAFETVAVGACWKLLSDTYAPKWAAPCLAVLGIFLTVVWFCNNEKTHFYAVYWLERVAIVEHKLVLLGAEDIDFAAQILTRRRTGFVRHRRLVQAVPVIFFIAWMILLGYGAGRFMVLESGAMHRMSYDSISLAVAIASLLAAGAAAWVARSSLSQAKQVADRDKKDWKQRKWFDLYFKAGEAYDALDRFQTMYPSGWNTVEFERDWNDLIRTVRSVHTMALVFPKNPAIDAFLSATGEFKDPKEALSKDRLAKIFDAVEGLRQNALVDPSVLG